MQLATVAHRPLAGQHFALDLLQHEQAQRFGRGQRLFQDAHHQFQLGQAVDPLIVRYPLDQPARVPFRNVPARFGAVDHELGQRFHEEVRPFACRLRDLVVEDEDGFGFFRVDPAIGPGRAAQRQDFLCRNRAVLGGLCGQGAEVQGHACRSLKRPITARLREST